jgi:hypothetical protein
MAIFVDTGITRDGKRLDARLGASARTGTNIFDQKDMHNQRKAAIAEAVKMFIRIYEDKYDEKPTKIYLNGNEDTLLRDFLREAHEANKKLPSDLQKDTKYISYSGEFEFEGVTITSGCKVQKGRAVAISWNGTDPFDENEDEE